LEIKTSPTSGPRPDLPARPPMATPSTGGVERSAGADDPATDARAESPIRVVVAEDSYLIREFLAATLSSAPEVELAAVCTNGKELVSAISYWHPDVVLTDIRMPPSGAEEGVRIAAALHESDPEVGVVVLSQYAEPAYALALLEKGTGRRAYLLKERIRNREELIGAIQTVARGGSVIDPVIVDVLIQARARAAKSRLAQLTPRERELLAEIASGKSNGAIAKSLFLTKRAVEKHVNSIFSKLNLPETEDVSRRVAAALIFLSEEDTSTVE
jgi:DNA-binding NarL/FixJ family response regulator